MKTSATARPLTPAQVKLHDFFAQVRWVALWRAIMEVHSSGGQGIRGARHAPATVMYPELAAGAAQATTRLRWHYTTLPFDVAAREFSIPRDIWEQKREAAGNPPLVDAALALEIQSMLRGLTAAFIREGGGAGAGDVGAARLAALWHVTC